MTVWFLIISRTERSENTLENTYENKKICLNVCGKKPIKSGKPIWRFIQEERWRVQIPAVVQAWDHATQTSYFPYGMQP